jgi:heterotetrameric sarcosine oxidase delta subunit
MMLIPCPFCGPRQETEFTYAGPDMGLRPEDAGALSSEDWVRALTVPPNPLGPVREHWRHSRGCGAWVTIRRDTRTHDILRPDDDG